MNIADLVNRALKHKTLPQVFDQLDYCRTLESLHEIDITEPIEACYHYQLKLWNLYLGYFGGQQNYIFRTFIYSYYSMQ